ncbi:MAG: hypothetical protein WC244_00950 [Patescibacteria group bacterium]|jgi:phosphomannomutase
MINPKIFKEYDIRGIYPAEINNEDGYRLGYAFVKFKKLKTIAVCKDKRIESAKLSKPFIQGAYDAGAKIFDLGVNCTPALFFAVGVKKFDGGVMITPSHNPNGYTGLKFCTVDGVPIGLKTGLKELQKIANAMVIKPLRKKAIVKKISIAGEYEKYCRSIVDFSHIQDLNVILDASDGAGSIMASHIFSKLKIKKTKINFVKGDKYPTHGLNPMLQESRDLLCSEVKKQKADLGIIWDGDADRCIFVDDQGVSVNSYHINCLLYQIMLLKYGSLKPGLPLVLDARLPVNISEMIVKMGGKPVVNRSGYTNILKKMQNKKYLFGSENSGHYFLNFLFSKELKKNYVFGDGIIPALLVMEYLAMSGLKLSEAIKIYRDKFVISGEINLKIGNFEKVKNKLSTMYKNYEQKNIDGLSVYGQGWFFNVRSSNTEPLVRLNVESQSIKVMEKEKVKLLKIIR